MNAPPLPPAPADADQRRATRPTPVYPSTGLPDPGLAQLRQARGSLDRRACHVIPPREARCFTVQAGQFFRILCPEGPQVGDLNLWNLHRRDERFYSGKTRALHGTHLTTGDRMWSSFPYLRPLATISHDTLGWYGRDADGGAIHDVIGTRCDPYTARLLWDVEYHHCCHSNLTRALAAFLGEERTEVEAAIHDVLNVFMCTGFDREDGRYFMKASPVRAGDFLEFFAEEDLLGCLSACPGGDCSTGHSSDEAACFPLHVEVFACEDPGILAQRRRVPVSAYGRSHG